MSQRDPMGTHSVAQCCRASPRCTLPQQSVTDRYGLVAISVWRHVVRWHCVLMNVQPRALSLCRTWVRAEPHRGEFHAPPRHNRDCGAAMDGLLDRISRCLWGSRRCRSRRAAWEPHSRLGVVLECSAQGKMSLWRTVVCTLAGVRPTCRSSATIVVGCCARAVPRCSDRFRHSLHLQTALSRQRYSLSR
jgi:hypothetical protein